MRLFRWNKEYHTKKQREHFVEEYGIDYTIKAITQMIINCGHEFIQKDSLFSCIFKFV